MEKCLNYIEIEVCLDKTKPIFLSVVYRPPSKGSDLESTDQLCAYLKEFDSKLPQIKKVFICGDFNCNMMSRYAMSSKIKDLCSSRSSIALGRHREQTCSEPSHPSSFMI